MTVSHQSDGKSGLGEYGRYEWDDAEFEACFRERKLKESAHSEARVEPVGDLRPLVTR